MAFKSPLWFPIAVGLSLLNLGGVAFATGALHTTTHAALALGFGLWAQRLRRQQAPGGGEVQERLESLEDGASKFETLEAEMNRLRQELSETQERLDFAERVLAQGRERGRVGPQP